MFEQYLYNVPGGTKSASPFVEAAHTLMVPVMQFVSPETAVFIIIIATFTLLFHLRFSPAVVYNSPAVLTTLGILGTFIGIALGLSSFNVNDVQHSVPSLIDGIKTAVWASAWGIFCALTIKLREIFFGISKKYTAKNPDTITIDDIAEVLAYIQQSLVGDKETNLLDQLQTANKDSKECFEKLNRTLEAFCKQMAISPSETMVNTPKELAAPPTK